MTGILDDDTRAQAIAALNDAFRRNGPSADWFVTAGVHAQGGAYVRAAHNAVMAFSVFTEDNDPYGEHDFGSFKLDGDTLFWKIDYYDRAMTSGSEDPANAALTRRVMTIMLAEEY